MYCEGYKNLKLGRDTYLTLNDKMNGFSCVSCSAPTCQCVNGINIANRMSHAHTLFA